MESQSLQKWAFANKTLKSLVFKIYHQAILIMGFPGGSMVKNLLANAGDSSSIPVSGRCPGEGKWQPTPVILAWEIPWLEEPGGLQSMGLQKSWTRLSN